MTTRSPGASRPDVAPRRERVAGKVRMVAKEPFTLETDDHAPGGVEVRPGEEFEVSKEGAADLRAWRVAKRVRASGRAARSHGR